VCVVCGVVYVCVCVACVCVRVRVCVCRAKFMYGIQAKLYRENNVNVCNDFGNLWSGLSLKCICLSSKHSAQNPLRFLTSRHDKRLK
jgi:hypothetical protein